MWFWVGWGFGFGCGLVGWLVEFPIVGCFLVGGFSPTPLKDMRVRQIGSSPEGSGVKIKNI